MCSHAPKVADIPRRWGRRCVWLSMMGVVCGRTIYLLRVDLHPLQSRGIWVPSAKILCVLLVGFGVTVCTPREAVLWVLVFFCRKASKRGVVFNRAPGDKRDKRLPLEKLSPGVVLSAPWVLGVTCGIRSLSQRCYLVAVSPTFLFTPTLDFCCFLCVRVSNGPCPPSPPCRICVMHL